MMSWVNMFSLVLCVAHRTRYFWRRPTEIYYELTATCYLWVVFTFIASCALRAHRSVFKKIFFVFIMSYDYRIKKEYSVCWGRLWQTGNDSS